MGHVESQDIMDWVCVSKVNNYYTRYYRNRPYDCDDCDYENTWMNGLWTRNGTFNNHPYYIKWNGNSAVNKYHFLYFQTYSGSLKDTYPNWAVAREMKNKWDLINDCTHKEYTFPRNNETSYNRCEYARCETLNFNWPQDATSTLGECVGKWKFYDKYIGWQMKPYVRVDNCTPWPTLSPTVPTLVPTQYPSVPPTEATPAPTGEPSAPTDTPSTSPTIEPTIVPTPQPSVRTVDPTNSPTTEPTTFRPTKEPTTVPTDWPTEDPTNGPSSDPTVMPTVRPTNKPTVGPTAGPTVEPSAKPSTYVPTTFEPTRYEPTTYEPTTMPSDQSVYETGTTSTTPDLDIDDLSAGSTGSATVGIIFVWIFAFC